MKSFPARCCFFSGSILASCITFQAARGQIIPDNTLPNNSVVSSQGRTVRIEEGTRIGKHLFHSFEKFSVSEGNTASFNNATDIQTIFSRVTGGNISRIDGILAANGNANVLLLNPTGILFGANAKLNIGGSFLATTADRLLFPEGEFGATNTDQPLLTLSTPIGLGFSNNAGSIVNRSTADNVGLKVQEGNSVTFVGGDVFLEGGRLTAAEGRVELGSVAGNQEVSLTAVESGWQVRYEEVQAFQDISLSDLASVNTSGDRGGAIHIQGRRVNLSSDAEVVSATFGGGVGDAIEIIASESIDMSGDYTRIATESSDTGTAGNVAIATGKLTIRDGAFIETVSLGESRSGNLTVKASESVELLGTSADGFASGLSALVGDNAIGEGRTIAVKTGKLTIQDGAEIFAYTSSTGRSVDITIEASESVELLGASAGGTFPSGLFAEVASGATGGGSTLIIETGKLIVQGGASVENSTFGAGNAGNLLVNASESIELIGAEPNQNIPSGLFAQVESGATGDGGLLTLETAQLLVKDGAQVSVTTFGAGNAGNLNVKVSESVILTGTEANNLLPSGLFARVEPGATGDGGTLNVDTQELVVLAGAQISTSALEGAGGTLTIDAADSILLSGTSPLGDAFSSSGLFVSAEPGATNDAGTLNITTEQLTVEEGARISADNFGTGEGASVNIDVNRLVIQSGGFIGAGSLVNPIGSINNNASGDVDDKRGPGGTVTVNATESIEIIGSGSIDITPVSSLFTRAEGTGDAGNLSIITPNLTVAEAGNINVSATGTGQAGSLNINAQDVTLDNGSLTATTRRGDRGNITLSNADTLLLRNSQITTNASEAATGGDITITSELTALLDDSDITANAERGRGGNIQITTQGLFQEPDSIIDAASNLGIDGTITINNPEVDPTSGVVELPSVPIDAEAIFAQDLCRLEDERIAGGSSFIITGRGGLTPTSEEPLGNRDQVVNWANREDIEVSESGRVGVRQRGESDTPARPIIQQSQGWVRTADGSVWLTANAPETTPQNSRIVHPDCRALR